MSVHDLSLFSATASGTDPFGLVTGWCMSAAAPKCVSR